MTALPEPQFITRAEYLALEEVATEKHEYFNGQIFALGSGTPLHADVTAMAGGTPRHADIIANVSGSFFGALRGHSCRPSSSDQRVHIEATGLDTYPDFIIKCPPERYAPDDKNALCNPALVVEVLSPSTASFDRGDKFLHYAQIPELNDYILVSQDRVHVEHFSRDGNNWLLRRYFLRKDVMKLDSLAIEIPIAEIYDGIEVPDGLLILHSPPEKSTPE